MSNKVTWESFKEYNREVWLEFYMRWNYAPWYEWVAQITWLVILVTYFKLTVTALVEWVEVAEVSAISELIFFGCMFGIIGGVFLLHFLFSNLVFFVVEKLNLRD